MKVEEAKKKFKCSWDTEQSTQQCDMHIWVILTSMTCQNYLNKYT